MKNCPKEVFRFLPISLVRGLSPEGIQADDGKAEDWI